MALRFSQRELRDFAAAWIALSVAFTLLLTDLTRVRNPAGTTGGTALDPLVEALLGPPMAISLVGVGVAFVLHELAHKVVAVRFGQVAEFRASYEMLLFAVLSALLGFLVAAPGAVHHRGRITLRQRGLIALAGPATNLLLVVPFAALTVLDGLPGRIGTIGVFANAILAAFNLVPYGPFDGATVREWNGVVHAVALGVAALLAAAVLFGPFP
jgi:Zn-dependent protease